MVSLDWSTDRTGGVTFVALRVENPDPDRSRRVRIENRLDGPVWPPRRHGRPVTGWDETGFEGVVGSGGTLALGYATPAEPADPPTAVADTEPVPDADVHDDAPGSVSTGGRAGDGQAALGLSAESDGRVDGETPAGVVRSLGNPVVPREAVPVPDTPGTGTDPGDSRANSRRELRDARDGTRTAPDHERSLSARLAAIERRLAALEGR